MEQNEYTHVFACDTHVLHMLICMIYVDVAMYLFGKTKCTRLSLMFYEYRETVGDDLTIIYMYIEDNLEMNVDMIKIK